MGTWFKTQGKTCKGNCKNDCGLTTKGTWALDKNCVMSKQGLKALERGRKVQGRFQKEVESVGTDDHPAWRIFLSGPTKSCKTCKFKYATVECPCREKGKAIGSEEALRRILGQAASIGISGNHAGAVLRYTRNPQAHKTRGQDLLMKTGYAVTKMFTCWTNRCKKNGQRAASQAPPTPAVDCTVLPKSMNGGSHPVGCPGAVWSNGSPAQRYCQGDNGKYPWWGSCCRWTGRSCVAKGMDIADAELGDLLEDSAKEEIDLLWGGGAAC